MRLFTFEHGPWAYRADFALYGGAVVLLALLLALDAPAAGRSTLAALAALGIAAWTLAEYGLHRLVLHHVQPFARWHAEHHRQPQALICTPTVLSAALFVGGVWLPAWALGGTWPATALTFGVLCGYLAYTLLHHAVHHRPMRSPWLRERQRWHALHHRRGETGHHGHFGVTSGLWDRAFGTDADPIGAGSAAHRR
jgi:cyclopropane-fatty-acyl-phospholipid synthase